MMLCGIGYLVTAQWVLLKSGSQITVETGTVLKIVNNGTLLLQD